MLGSKEGTEYYEGGDYFSNTNADEQTLYAMWDNYIIFNANGGSETPEPQILRYAENITLPAGAGYNTNSYEGFIQGWGKSQDTTVGDAYKPSATYSDYDCGANTTLYAIWGTFSPGVYVAYSPTAGTFTSEGTYNGDTNKDFSTTEGLMWRVLKDDGKTLTLIADTTANTGFTLKGANGYNNGVLLLNNACKAMYSNSTFSATGRSIKAEDIEAVSSAASTGATVQGSQRSEFCLS